MAPIIKVCNGLFLKRTDGGLKHVATGALIRTGLELFVALNTLSMEGVSSTEHFASFNLVGFVAVETAGRKAFSFRRSLVAVAAGARGFLFIAGVMVTIDAGGPVSAGRSVRIVVEEDFSGRGVEHQPDRGFWGGLGKGGKTDDGNEQEMDRETIGYQQLPLGSHWRYPYAFISMWIPMGDTKVVQDL
jgi:hypothetical protein